MKKNKIMRFASLVLVLTLLSTCAISGTFAKYVTQDTAKDEARVAKWGVTLTATDDSNFETSYKTDDTTNYQGTLTVESSDTDSVVAPGTKGNAIKFKIAGTPEVATKVGIDMTVTSDVYVKAGDHADDTTTDGTTFNLAEAYYPVVFTLKQTAGQIKQGDQLVDINAENAPTLVTGNLAAIETYLENTYAASAYYAPNTKLDAEFELNWEWMFENTGKDAADTLLGNVAANKVTDENVSTKIDYTITFTVTQVD